MNKFDKISADLFNKIRGRFESVTIGDKEGKMTNVPEEARYFDFDYVASEMPLGKVSVGLDEQDGLTVIVAKDFVSNQMENIQDDWYNFLKELRIFAKKRLMKFDVRDINKTNLTKKDYKFLSNNRNKENTMSESKMYGTNKTSFQRIGNARLAIRHSSPIGEGESRLKNISSIFVETPEGEKFKYPVKHLQGARALAVHVSEGGHAFDDFGKYITGLSEELASLGKFKTYMGRKSVMAEALSEYMDVVNTRVKDVRKEISNLQKPAYYAETFANFVTPVMEQVPTDIEEAWVDQLTVKQFNEELKDVFPYIYNLVGESMVEELGPDDLMDESALMAYAGKKKHGAEYMKKAAKAGREGASQQELGALKDKYSKAAKKKTVGEEFEEALDSLMGQFAEGKDGEITKDSVKKSALELLVDIAKTSKQYKGEVTDDQVHYLGSLVHDFDMAGIETEKYSEIEKLFRTASATKKADMEMIQPAYAQAKNLDEAYSAGDENEEGMVSNCCGAPIMDVYQGHGRCSDCKEMASAVAEESVNEAIGDSAECFYNLQDEFAGEEATGAHKIIIDELVRYLSGDQLEDFCDDFKRHHMDG